MLLNRIRRAVVIVVLAAASSSFHLADLHAAPRGESQGDRHERAVARPSFHLWSFLVGLWEQAGLRIDDNG